MIEQIVAFLGPWTWVVFGLVMLGLEILLPSTFLLWPGLAALVVGMVTLAMGMDSPMWPWQAQVLVFLTLTLVIAFLGRNMMRMNRWDESERSDLNERGVQLVGQTAVLSEPIVNGHGRAKIGDTTWRVRGSDAKAGVSVRVLSADGGTLNVETI